MADKPQHDNEPGDKPGRDNRTGQSIALLIGCLAISVLLWVLWPRYGIGLVYQQVPAGLAESPAAGQADGKLPPKAEAAPGQQRQPRQQQQVQDQQQAEPPDMMARYGQTGDLFGGLNTFLTGVAGAAVLWAGFMQYHTMKKALADSEHEREHRVRQEFESFFFQLLHLSEATTAKLVYTSGRDEPRYGSRALDKYAYEIHCRVRDANPARPDETLDLLVRHFLMKAYDLRPSLFGPHFRLLKQTFDYVAASPLTPADKFRYADIARGQIGEGALLMLALYGLTCEGKGLAERIEEFRLLEHLHPRYRTLYEGALLLGYRKSAFVAEEVKTDHVPLLRDDHFSYLETERRLLKDEADRRHDARRAAPVRARRQRGTPARPRN